MASSLIFVTAHFTLQKTGLQGLAYLHSSRAQFWNMLVALTPKECARTWKLPPALTSHPGRPSSR